jgi:AAA domain, putative AbiEii toxin, Type IV TA system
MKQFDLKFNEQQFKELTKGYTDFIKYFNENVITPNTLFNFEKSKLNFVETKNAKEQSVLEKDVAIIEVPLSSEGLAFLKEFINQYDAINTGSNFIKFQWEGISSGEDTLLGIYSRFFNMMNENVGENVVILLDEIEHSLHPEWQRRIVSNLLEYLPYVFSNCKSIQIVLATNVPFLIADIPTKNIVYLESKGLENAGERMVTSTREIFTQTFAANIHSLLINNFFMDSTIGEFSVGKINSVIRMLKSKKKEENDYSRQEIQRVIQTVGEPIIRNKLQSMYSEKYDEDVRALEMAELINDFREDGDYSAEKVNSLLNEILLKSKKENNNE